MFGLFYNPKKDKYNSDGVVEPEDRIPYNSDGTTHLEDGLVRVHPTDEDDEEDNIPAGSIASVK